MRLSRGKTQVKTKLIVILILAGLAQAQAARTVSLSWTASTSVGVTGYNVYRCTAPCAPTVAMSPLNTAAISTTSFIDTSAAVGQTYVYGITATAPACTPTTPTTSICGASDMSAPSTTTIPPQPAVVVTVTVVVQ
jgi:large repetitive protein